MTLALARNLTISIGASCIQDGLWDCLEKSFGAAWVFALAFYH